MSFRVHLLVMVFTGLISLLAVIIGSDFIGEYAGEELKRAEQRLVPKLELGHGAKVELVRLTRAYQDAVAAQEPSLLARAEEHKNAMLVLISEAERALPRAATARLRFEVNDYAELATNVSRLLLNGEGSEASVDQMAEMQRRLRRLERSLDETAALDRTELKLAFSQAQTANRRAADFRRWVGIAGATLLLALGYLISRRVIQRVSALQAGFARFAHGRFDELIPVESHDELGLAARQANAMAQSLKTSEELRGAQDWVRKQQLELGLSLGGNVTETAATTSALEFLTSATGARASAIYLATEDGSLALAGSLGASGDRLEPHSVRKQRFAAHEGLIGRAFLTREVTVWNEVPHGYFELGSALGSSSASHLVFLPLWNGEQPVGAIEFALAEPLSERGRSLLQVVGSTLAVSLQAAGARAAAAKLLSETQDQARRLSKQEEELRVANQELLERQNALRQANEELEEQGETLARRNQELSLARERVQSKADELARVSRYKSQFLANMSHELRTPLNSMLLLSRLLADNESGTLSARQVEQCATIHSAGLDLLALINQVLDLSKIEAGKTEVEYKTVQLGALCTSLDRMFRPLAEQQGLEFVIRRDPEAEQLHTDPLRLERILNNLLGNAIKFTERGSVTLEIKALPAAHAPPGPEGHEAFSFIVRDTGIGIAAEEQARIFAPFEQIDSTTARRYQGTGLGLAIARESALLLGGEIVLESTPHEGSCFTLVLPNGRVAAQLSDVETATHLPAFRAVQATEPLPVSVDPLLLIIEDDPILSEQLSEIVESMGLGARVATSGAEGLELASRLRPRGIVLDIKLPDLDGWTVLDRLKSSPSTREIPVHIISALDAPEGSLDSGAVGYLTKPASREQLRDAIRCLVPVHPERGTVLIVEDNPGEGLALVSLLEAAHYRTTHVATAEQALNILKGQRVDCILLDLGLPAMDGLAFLEQLRKMPESKRMRVIVHTGRTLSRPESRELAAYAEAIVLKDGDSATRILEEIRLFASHISASSIPPPDKDEEAAPFQAIIAGLCVLLVEDDMRTVYSISAFLQSKGCAVVTAENGREGLGALSKNATIDCVLMDIMMPEMDGYEAMREIRKNPRWTSLPIIAVTAKAMPGERERCLAAGATDYLSKPIDTGRLVSKLLKVTSKGAPHANG
jgi:CheY-like chemotaxis protein